MPSVTYVQHDGSRQTLDLPEGTSVMAGAQSNALPGILGDCGGAQQCSTCHVYVEEVWLPKLSPAEAGEHEMLEFAAAERRPNSRLGCQLKMSAALDGLVVRVPEKQT